jgi:hypothetical protein
MVQRVERGARAAAHGHGLVAATEACVLVQLHDSDAEHDVRLGHRAGHTAGDPVHDRGGYGVVRVVLHHREGALEELVGPHGPVQSEAHDHGDLAAQVGAQRAQGRADIHWPCAVRYADGGTPPRRRRAGGNGVIERV